MTNFVIVTEGRCGSTLLVHVLNSFKQVLCSGEIIGYYALDRFLKNKHNAVVPYKKLRMGFLGRQVDKKSTHPFFKPEEIEIKDEYKFTDLFPPKYRASGTKSIIQSPDLEFFLMNNHFYKIILLTRKNKGLWIASMKRAGFKNGNIKHLTEIHNKYVAYSKKYDNTFLLYYEDIKNCQFKELFDFLKIGDLYDEKLIKEKLHDICSYQCRQNISQIVKANKSIK